MIKDIIKNSEFIKVKGNVIDLGYMNGWDFKVGVREVLNELKQYMVSGSYSNSNLGNCTYEYSSVIDDGTERYVVVYKVDSSD
jgi:hypothetical protein